MNYRIKNLWVYVLFIGFLLFLFGYICFSFDIPRNHTYQPSDTEYKQITNEIERLENLSKKGYDTDKQ